MTYVFYPNLNLFLYHLGNGFGDPETKIAENLQTFWRNLPPELQKSDLAITPANSPTDYSNLLPQQGFDKAVHWYDTKVGDYAIKGYYYPVILDDSFGLLLNAYTADVDNYQLTTCFQALKSVGKEKTANLGKTWMLSACLPPDSSTLPDNLASSIYQDFTGQKLPKYSQGMFLGAKIYEIWQPPTAWESVEENHHVLIIVYPDQETEKATASYYQSWLQLFYYRNKILWAFLQTRQLKRRLKASFARVYQTDENLTECSNEELEFILEKNYNFLREYTKNLNYLEIQLHTIELNLRNYRKQINSLVEEASQEKEEKPQFGETNLKFAAHFCTKVKQYYQLQIKEDIGSFSPGLRLLEDEVNTIRGILEARRTESDRQLNQLVAATGVGATISAVSATVIVAQPPQNKHPVYFYSFTTLFSLGLGFFFAFACLSLFGRK